MATTHRLRIDFDDSTGVIAVTVTSSAQLPGGPLSTVSFPLNFDSERAAPELKRRAGESDEAYTARFAKTIPAQIDMPVELVAGLKEKLAAIVAAAQEVSGHYAGRAAAVHALDAVGKVPEGITKKLRLGGMGSPATGDTTPKKG